MNKKLSALISLLILILAPSAAVAGKKTKGKPPQSPSKTIYDFTDPAIDFSDCDNRNVNKPGLWVQYGTTPAGKRWRQSPRHPS